MAALAATSAAAAVVAALLATPPLARPLGVLVDPFASLRGRRQPARAGSQDGGTAEDGTLSRNRASAGVGA